MKLIKQNNSAGGLIFKQNNNGKAMKQNYNFGKAFKFGGSSVRASSDFNHLMSNGFSFLVWGQNWLGTSNPDQFFTLIFDNTISLAFSPRGTINSLTLRLLGDPAIGDINLVSSTMAHENTSFLIGVVNNKITYNGAFTTIPGIPDGYFAGKTLTNISFPNGSNNMTGLINDIVIYDRNIADAEVSYFFNNRLGNEELNSLGLISKYKNDSAVIADNSVVLEDYKGAHNIELINLPAGTLQEQLDYANANLFESW